jgi:hypothetical protein
VRETVGAQSNLEVLPIVVKLLGGESVVASFPGWTAVPGEDLDEAVGIIPGKGDPWDKGEGDAGKGGFEIPAFEVPGRFTKAPVALKELGFVEFPSEIDHGRNLLAS